MTRISPGHPPDVPDPPPGVTFKTAEARTLWRQFTAARRVDAWRSIDLLLVAKVVHLELELRRSREALEGQDMVIEKASGSKAVHPMIGNIELLQSQQLSIIRVLGLGISGRRGIALNAAGTRSAHKEAARKSPNSTIESLVGSR